MSLKIAYPANILDSTEKYLVHQTNSTSLGCAGLAAAIFKKWPNSNIYMLRKGVTGILKGHEAGNIVITGDGKTERFIIHAMGQIKAGLPYNPNDMSFHRKDFFQSCLDKITALPDLGSIAMPWKIGCGLAGGDWEDYMEMISKFAEKIDVDVVLYRREKD